MTGEAKAPLVDLGLGGDGDEIVAIEEVERQFGIRLDTSDASTWRTVGDVYASVLRALPPGSADAADTWRTFARAISRETGVDPDRVRPETFLLAHMGPPRPLNSLLRFAILGMAIAAGYAAHSWSQPQPVACSAPRSGWGQIDGRSDPEIQINSVMLDHAGRIFWNHYPISEQAFVSLLRTARQRRPVPVIILQTEMGVACRSLEQVRDRIDSEMQCKIGDGRCRETVHWPAPRPPVAASKASSR